MAAGENARNPDSYRDAKTQRTRHVGVGPDRPLHWHLFSLRLCVFACFFSSATYADSDSLAVLNYKLSLSSSYSTYSNWSSGNHDNFSFQGNADASYFVKLSRFRQQYLFRSALNYVKYIDSLWVKAADYWKLTMRFTDQP